MNTVKLSAWVQHADSFFVLRPAWASGMNRQGIETMLIWAHSKIVHKRNGSWICHGEYENIFDTAWRDRMEFGSSDAGI
jgi:hypothetical protein